MSGVATEEPMTQANAIVHSFDGAWERERESSERSRLASLVLQQYDRDHVPLRRYLLFLGANADASEELVQEAFLRLHRHLIGGGDRTNLRAWLFRVAQNLLRNERASLRNRLSDSLDENTVSELPALESSPEESLLERERLEHLRLRAGVLTIAERQCLVLRAQGFTYREIAEVTQLSISTVAENIQRGLRRLQESSGEEA